MTDHRIVSRQEWLRARRALLEEEKALTRQRDALAARRRALPWVRVDEPYGFDTVDGPRTLAELFGDKNQLLVQHFMFGADWEQGCPSCSFWADSVDRVSVHLAARDISFVAVSTAPLATLQAYRERMGWSFEWVSSGGSRFNHDFHVTATSEELEAGRMDYNFREVDNTHSELPGASAFFKDEDGAVFHTYSTYARGLDTLNGAYHWIDIAPLGRNEDGLEWPMAWLRRRDQYE